MEYDIGMDTEQGKKIPLRESLLPQYAVVQACLDAGLSHGEIAKGIGKSRPSVTYAHKQLSGKYDLTSVKHVKLASTVHKMTLQAVTDPAVYEALQIKPKYSDVTAAVDRVMDRAQPKIAHNLNVNVDLDIDPVDLSRYKR
jgi:hypothetical protein